MAILGDRGSVASGAFRILLQYSLGELHRKMETATGDDLIRLQGACQHLRQWESHMEKASARVTHARRPNSYL
jgi:hypothetical protein